MPFSGRACPWRESIGYAERLAAISAAEFSFRNYESADFSEEPFSTVFAEKEIRVSNRAAIVNLMIGLDEYTISTRIFPEYLQGRQIISVPLAEQETMHIGYVLCKEQGLSSLGRIYERLEKIRSLMSIGQTMQTYTKYVLPMKSRLQYDGIKIAKGDLGMLGYVLANFLYMPV